MLEWNYKASEAKRLSGKHTERRANHMNKQTNKTPNIRIIVDFSVAKLEARTEWQNNHKYLR